MSSPLPPDWKQKRAEPKFSVSASQLETFDWASDGCHRKWWFQSVRKLPQRKKGSQTFGTALHAVIERYLLADDFGNDATGKPVDLFPAGWEAPIDRYGRSEGTISPAEQDLIKQLVGEAISSGVLERRQGRRVEKEFRLPLATVNGTVIETSGFLDVSYLEPEACVEDHKSTKNMSYAKTPKTLAKNHQMLLYGAVLLQELAAAGKPIPATVSLRHNIYCKDPSNKKVKKAQCEVTAETLQAHWQQFQQQAGIMEQYRRLAENHFDIPEPPNVARACGKFGGCDFADICAGKESPEYYERRITQLTVSGSNPALFPSPSPQEIVMAPSLAQLQAARAAAGVKPIAAPAAAFLPPQPPAQPAAAPVLPTLSPASISAGHRLPPWATAGVDVNNGLGFTSTGEPCQISAARANADGRATPQYFDFSVSGEGTVAWKIKPGVLDPKDEPAFVGVTPLSVNWAPPVVQSQAQVQVAPAAPAAPAPLPWNAAADPAPAGQWPTPAIQGLVTPAPAPAPAVQKPAQAAPKAPKAPKAAKAAQEPALAPAGTPAGASAQEFTLYVGCAPVGGEFAVLSEIFAVAAPQAAAALGAKSYYEADAFKRRDMLSSGATNIAAAFKFTDLVVDVKSPDHDALTNALMPLAASVVRSFGA